MTETLLAPRSGQRRANEDPRMWPVWSRPAEPLEPLPEAATVASTSFLVMAMVCLWFILHVLVLGGLEQHRAQDRLYGEFRTQLAAATAPTGGIIPPGSPVALLRIPHLGLAQVIVEGTSAGVMLNGPGHRRDTVLPGQAGVSIVYGRARAFGASFRDLATKAVGEDLSFVTAQGTSAYRIEGVRRAGDPIPPLLKANEGRVTFVAAEGNGRLSMLSAGHVIYIDAALKSKSFTAPAGRLNAISPAEMPMASDTSAMPVLALLLGALAVATVGIVFARRRFGLVLSWVIGAPIILALAWMASDLAMYLLPNLL